MQHNSGILKLFTLLFLTFGMVGFAVAQQVSTQALPSPRVRITQAIDEHQLIQLQGNTHPLARPEFDQGAAPPGMLLHRMLLVLNRAPEQEAALQQFLMDLHDTSSPNYYRWLTPQQFGQQFGPADADIQTVTSWLESHGFQVAKVSNGRTVIEFSGTVSQVKETFHTDVHKFAVNGEDHWANTNDPQIPAALAAVVAGPATLHNFVKRPMLASTRQLVHKQRSPSGDVNLVNQQNQVFHAVGPADLATIYNVPDAFTTNQFNGNSVTVGVVARSNIDLGDLTSFYTTFGVSPTPTTVGSTRALPNVILNGPDPTNLGGDEEVEAVLDASYAGSLALNATVDFVVSQTTEATDGVDLSEVFIVDNNLADVMTESFGECETSATKALATASKNVAQQAAAQGITFSASTGDSGAVCSFTATNTIDVAFPASLPNVVAVGGTMFTNDSPPNDANFWSANNNQFTLESALKFIPETVWNETIPGQGQGSGGGGVSTLFAAPPWQLSTGITGLTGTMRQLPDVSLNAAALHDPYVLCIADLGAPCGAGDIFTVGGTSASTPTFTSIMALVDQSQKGRQGEAGYVLYKLASDENSSLASCNASTGSGPTSSTCVFADVTTGNNVITGEATAAGPSSTDFTAATGYDLASGLGSPNATNLINMWSTAAGVRTRATTVTLPGVNPTTATHGSLITFSVNVAPATGSGTPTGNVSLIANVNTAGQAGTSGVVLSSFTLTGGSLTNATTNGLPGGSYQIHAHYEGDGTFLAGDSNAVSVKITKENSSTQVELVVVNVNTGVASIVSSLPYGANSAVRANVLNSKGQPCTGAQVEIATTSGCPTGSVTINENTGAPLDGGTFALNSLGYTEDQAVGTTLAPGNYALTAAYPGDASFNASPAGTPDNITISQAVTSTAVMPSTTSVAAGGLVTLTATITTQSFGNPPSGTVTFFSNGVQIGGSVPVSGSFSTAAPGFAVGTAVLSTALTALPPVMRPDKGNPWMLPLLLTIVAIAMLAALVYGSRRRYAYAGLALLLLFLAGMAACGGGGGGGGAVGTPTASPRNIAATRTIQRAQRARYRSPSNSRAECAARHQIQARN